jgi:hypothetical protein
MGLQFGICVVYESGVPSNVVWTSSEVLESDSDSLSVDVELEICFIGPYMASASGPSRIRDTFLKKKKKKLNFKFKKYFYKIDAGRGTNGFLQMEKYFNEMGQTYKADPK